MERGKFVTLEGIEGSGKSLQLTLLQSELTRRGVRFVTTREPGGTAFGLEVRKILLHRDGPPREPISELLLYLADRYQHLKEGIEPALAAGCHVFCDRYHDATLAYQGHARGLGFELIDRLAEVLALPVPDLTLVLDLEVEPALQRARARNAGSEIWGRFEEEDLDFHRRVREGYRLLSVREPWRVLLVDASGPPEETLEHILRILSERGIPDQAQHC
ncbi:MAG: dTMP kinase [Acidobacteriota bacterium]